MAGLASILRMLGGIPGRLDEAQYEHTPEYRERMARMDLGEDLGEADVPTGDMEPVGEKRTGRLSKFGNFTKGVLPEMLRGALVAASNPTPGKVGTAGDIFGAIGAVSDDKQNRDMLQYKIDRQLEQDAMDRRLNEAKARDYEAQADFNQWRTQQAVTAKPKAEKPTKSQQVDEQIGLFRRVMKRDPNERELQTILGTHGPQYDVRGEESVWAQLLAKASTPEERDAVLAQQAAAAKRIAEAKSSGTAKGRLAYPVPKILKGANEYFQQDVSLGPDDKVKADYKGTGVATPKPAPRQAPKPRYRLETDKDGKQWRINIDNPSDKVETGIEKKVGGSSQSDLRKELTEKLLGGGKPDSAAPSKPKYSVGQTVKLKNGQTVTIKRITPDGKYEY